MLLHWPYVFQWILLCSSISALVGGNYLWQQIIMCPYKLCSLWLCINQCSWENAFAPHPTRPWATQSSIERFAKIALSVLQRLHWAFCKDCIERFAKIALGVLRRLHAVVYWVLAPYAPPFNVRLQTSMVSCGTYRAENQVSTCTNDALLLSKYG